MDFNHAMTFRRKLALLSMTLFTSLLLAAPLASAGITVSSDGGSSSGDLSDQCGDVSDGIGGALGCETTDKIIDFTEYQGELEGPDAAGYDSALTQTTDARDFIQTIVNFALSFLGIVAVVVVIYGGILYVLSRGDEEMVSKGKKTMGYAMMGIILILGSFALVNTLIGATGGGNSSTIGGGGAAGTTIDESGAAFDTDAVLREIEDIVTDYIANYENFQTVSSEVENMLGLEVPYTIEMDVEDKSLSGTIDYVNEWLSGQDNDRQDTVVIEDSEHLRNFTDEIEDSLSDIQNAVDPFSLTYEASQDLYDFLRSGGSLDELLDANNSGVLAWAMDLLIPIAYAEGNLDIPGFLNELAEDGVNAGSCADGLDADTGEYTSTVKGSSGNHSGTSSSGIGGVHTQTYDADLDLVSGTKDTCEGVYAVYVAAVDDYLNTLRTPSTVGPGGYIYDGLLERAEDLQALFETDAVDGSGSSLQELNDAASALYRLIDQEASSIEQRTNAVEQGSLIGSSRLNSVIQTADEFYQLVENIQFVEVTLTASTTGGNAPLIVNFDALGTEDPTGQTVEDSQIFWDFGDEDQDGFTPLDGYWGASATHTYEKAGTYRVRLKAVSSDPNIAAGLAVVSILVEPPKSQIVLTAKTSSTSKPYDIADFTVFPAIDRNTYKVTMAEAQEGITFDASGTKDGDGNTTGIVQYEWDFGDNTIETGGSELSAITHAYGEEGQYVVSLTVTDATGVQDRKIFNLYVASPAARASCLPTTVKVDESVKCDGAQSSADIGTIVRYDWSAVDANGDSVDLETNSGSSINMSFDKPGVYTVTLTVTDSSNTPDSTTTSIVVESQEPVALFDVTAPNDQEPAIRVFDATDSYDPDEDDVLSYEWNFDGEEGEDYDILEGDEDEAEVTVEFYKIADYDVELTVRDQYEDEELQKSDTEVETVSITSLLDVDMELDGESARFLDENGEVEVEFTAFSDNATFFEIDYDDGETGATDSISRGEATFSHTYTTAGVFNVTLTAADDEGNTNSVSARVYISPGDAPIAVIEVTSEGEDIGDAGDLHGNVNTVFRFDASDSVNIDGSNSGLSYSWNFGDGSTSSQKSVTHSFEELATYTITLTVRDQSDSTLENQSTVSIEIEGLSPEAKSMTLTPQGDSLETPLQVNVNIEAEDQDGSITFYKGWYYALDDSATELGTVVSQSSNFTITVNTNGEEGDEIEYGFAVEVTDNDNNTTTLDEDKHPTLEVVNGPNDNPVASFSVDRTSIFLGETLIISDTSYDPDGDIESVWVDLEGNGFYDNDPIDGTSLEWTPTQVYPDGVEIQVKVEDNSGATDTSEKLRVYVDAVTDPPEAAFLTNIDGNTVEFSNNAKLDEGVSLQGVYWDINIADDSDGDGDATNDIDYLEENFSHTYEDLGTYQVKFTVVDETGQSDSVTLDVQVIDAQDPVADFTYSVEEEGGTVIDFRNNSTVDEDNELTVRSYSWDFDLDVDSDGDDDPENDVDSTGRSPNHDFEDFGTYQVRLTVVDSIGQEDSITQEVLVPNPIEPVEAVLTAVPQPNANNQVVLDGSEGEITFYFSANGGSGKYEFTIDKNIFFDTDEDGIRENDADHEAKKSGSWKTPFYESYGQIVVKLTVTDLETGESDVDTIQVVFQGSLGAANLFNATPSEMLFLILSALLAAILGTTLVFRNQITSTKR